MQGGREGLILEGWAALPTYTKGNALSQYLFVNGRPVRDRLMLGAVRAAYADYLPRDRHPVVALFIAVEPREVDVNVHPAKTEVRFRDSGLVRASIVRALQAALARDTQRTATTGGDATIAAFRPNLGPAARWLGLARLSGFPDAGRDRARRFRRGRAGGVRHRRARLRRRSSPKPRPISSIVHSARRARSCTRLTSWRRRATAS